MKHLLKQPASYCLPLAMAASACLPPACNAGGMMDRLGDMERQVLGGTHHEQPLEQPMEALEQRVIGSPRSGPVSQRLEALKRMMGTGKATGHRVLCGGDSAT